MERDALKEGLGARAGMDQTVASAVLARVALVVHQLLYVCGVFALLALVPAALVARHLGVAVEDADGGFVSDEGERLADEGVGDRVVVAVEAHVGGLA